MDITAWVVLTGKTDTNFYLPNHPLLFFSFPCCSCSKIVPIILGLSSAHIPVALRNHFSTYKTKRFTEQGLLNQSFCKIQCSNFPSHILQKSLKGWNMHTPDKSLPTFFFKQNQYIGKFLDISIIKTKISKRLDKQFYHYL